MEEAAESGVAKAKAAEEAAKLLEDEEDETAELQHLGIDPEDHTLTLHLYFNDDLTEG